MRRKMTLFCIKAVLYMLIFYVAQMCNVFVYWKLSGAYMFFAGYMTHQFLMKFTEEDLGSDDKECKEV